MKDNGIPTTLYESVEPAYVLSRTAQKEIDRAISEEDEAQNLRKKAEICEQQAMRHRKNAEKLHAAARKLAE